MDETTAGVRVRREPPAFRRVQVREVMRLTPRLVRVTVGGPELEGFVVEQPAASVRLLVPPPDGNLVIPTWERNLFLLPDGSRAPIRTMTPLRVDPHEGRMDLEIVIHDGGVASAWAFNAEPGAEAAISGPARGWTVSAEAEAFVIAGDESAIPAIGQLLDVLPPDKPVKAIIEVSAPDARLELPKHPTADVEWLQAAPSAAPGAAMADAVIAETLEPGTNVWAAGEAAAVQRIRRHLFDELGFARSDTWIRGYWKHGRAGDDSDD